ncbi:MAG: glutaredoxin [Erysipelotrichaceae bacterium]|nr:glutaredoxin [Erysipelotrichaceae bacterium]
MKKIIGSLLVSVLLLTGCSEKVTKLNVTLTSLDSIEVDMSSYHNMSVSKHVFKKVTFGQANTLYASESNAGGSAVVVYGYPGCPFCQQAMHVLNDAAEALGIYVYYVEATQEYEGKQADIDTLMSLISEYLLKENKSDQLYVPQVFVIKNGKIVGSHLSLVNSYRGGNLSDGQYKELKNIYIRIMKKLSD